MTDKLKELRQELTCLKKLQEHYAGRTLENIIQNVEMEIKWHERME